MNISTRRIVALVVLLSVLAVAAQVKRPPELPEQSEPPLRLPTSQKYVSVLELANAGIETGDWAVAVTLLQRLLDLEESSFATVKRKDADGKETATIVELRSEAEKIMAALPKAGREFYQQEYGKKAAELVRRARDVGKGIPEDRELLAEVMRRFLFTEAGGEAAGLMGTTALDRDSLALATYCFDRLLVAVPPEKLSSKLLMSMAIAFRRGGDAAKSAEIAKVLVAKLDKERPVFGAPNINAKEVAAELEKHTAPKPVVQEGWPMFGGNAQRSKAGRGGPALLDPEWRHEIFTERATREYLKQAREMLQQQGQPVLLESHPITTVATVDKTTKVPLVVYRSYWGIHARAVKDVDKDIKNGDMFWEAPSNWSLDWMLREPKHVGALTQWLQAYLNNRVRPSILFENSSVGSLSADDARVYMVEELMVPPTGTTVPPGFPGQPVPAMGGALGDAIHHNTLQAYELDSGKLLWEAPDSRKARDDADPLGNGYFLGPPLPLAGKLYVMNQKDGSMRLVTLDPKTGQLLKAHRLAEVRDKIEDSIRRIDALHLAHSEGVLVCPTNSGGVIGYDLMANTIRWAYAYSTRRPVGNQARGFPPEVPAPPAKTWHAAGPIIAGSRVVITASDADALHCIGLRDGRPLWKVTRNEDDLYVGGVIDNVVVVVGKKTCRGISLENGKALWTLETGEPSGFGMATGSQYHLPLRVGTRGKEPEICIIDAAKGQIVAHVRSRKKEVPGNLVFFDDRLVSISPSGIAVYPLMELELKRIDELLKKNSPKDPEGLSKRGSLRLDKGDLQGAVEDFRMALEGKPPRELAERIQSGMFDALTELLQRDFKGGEKHLKDYERACRDIVDPGDAGEEKARHEAERARRLSIYHYTIALGRQQQDQLLEAAQACIDLVELNPPGNEFSPPNDPGLRVSATVWAQSQMKAILDKASPEVRKKIEAEIEQRAKKLMQDDKLKTRPIFLQGVESQAGREQRLAAARKLMANNAFLEAEMCLLPVREQKHDRKHAAQATELLAQVCMRKGLLPDAVKFYRELNERFPNDVVRDNKTGSDLFNDLATDKRMLPYLEDPKPAPRKFKVTEETGARAFQWVSQLEGAGEQLPLFQNRSFAIGPQYMHLKMLDAADTELWSQRLSVNELFSVLQNYPSPHLQYQSLGHLAFVHLASMAICIDPESRTTLWERNLHSTVTNPVVRSSVVNGDGTLLIHYVDGWHQRIPRAGLATLDAIVLQTDKGLEAVEPVSGRTLWLRPEIPASAHIFRDESHLYVVEVDVNGQSQRNHVFRIADGSRVAAKDFAASWNAKYHLHGGTIVVFEGYDHEGKTVRQYDVLQGKDRWSKKLAPNAFMMTGHADGLVGFYEPGGKATVIDLDTGKTVIEFKIDAQHIKKLEEVHVLRGSDGIYLACKRSVAPPLVTPAEPNFVRGAGLHTAPVNGRVIAFDPAGKRRWECDMENQRLLISNFDDYPVLIAATRYDVTNAMGTNAHTVRPIRIVDRRTGKLVHDEMHEDAEIGSFQYVRKDEKTKSVEMRGAYFRMRIEGVEGGK